MIDPSVLEGGLDEADSSDLLDSESGDTDSGEADSDSSDSDATDTGDSDLAECIQGTNPQGGFDPGDYPVGTCPAFVCDEGWGHDAGQLPIAWTLAFPTPESEDSYTPIAVVPHSGGGVLIVARRDAGAELSAVSAQGDLLSSTMLPTSLFITEAEAGTGMIFLAAFDEQDSSSSVLAISETGELLWSTPVESVIRTLAAVPEGGVLAALIVEGGGGQLVRIDDAGMTQWTAPTLAPSGVGISPAGRIVVTGHQPLEFIHHFVDIHAPDGTLLGQAPAPGMIGELADLHFLDEQRMLGIGSHTVDTNGDPSSDAVVRLVDLDPPASVWVHEYNRALSNCIYDFPSPYEQPTWDSFDAMVRLADGSFLIAAVEQGVWTETDINEVVQPRVIHIDEDGEFLASDRGLWAGQGKALAAGEDGSAYAVLTIGGMWNYDGPNDGFYLRKYTP